MTIIKLSPEVLFTTDQLIKLDSSDITYLQNAAEETDRKRVRLCTHTNISELTHEMFIVHPKNAYVRPHKHINKSESLHIISGTLDLITFNNEGQIIDVLNMGAYESGTAFYHRTSDDSYHSMIITSDIVIFHEVTGGPFNPTDTVWSPWSPEESDIPACLIYQSNIKEESSSFLNKREDL